MITLKKALVAAFMLLTVCVSAQITFETGFYLDNNGIKTEGFIKNEGWKNNPLHFVFKTSENAPEQSKNIDAVSAFEVSSYRYIRYTVLIERSSQITGSLSTSPRPEYKTETLFLKVLSTGKLNLYSYEDGNIRKYFVGTDISAPPVQLLNYMFLENNTVKQLSNYKQQLLNLMRDEITDTGKFSRISYNDQSLIKLFREYNGTDDTDNNTSANTGSTFHLNIKAGAGIANMDAGVLYYFNYNSKLSNQPVYQLGAEAEIVLPFNRNKWSLFAAPSVQFYKNDAVNVTMIGSTPDYDGWLVKYNFIDIPFGARYSMYINPNNRVYISAAYDLNLVIGNSYVQYGNLLKENLSSTNGMLIGAGYMLNNRFGAEVNYYFKRDIIRKPNWNSGYKSINLLITYRLF